MMVDRTRWDVFDPEGAEIRTLRGLVDFRGQRVLEIGCGDGRLTRRYAAEAADVVGLDTDAEAIAVAKATAEALWRQRVCYLAADITTLELEPGRFDIALFARSM